MTEGTLASAVLLPEPSPPPQPEPALKRDQDYYHHHHQAPNYPKRRKSSLTSHAPSSPDSKRRRLSPRPSDRKPSSPDTAAAARPRRPRDEDRKRGQRLFGALLGTLSQSGPSNNAAQKRRADIERRQQDKLKLQDEAYGELRRRRREEKEQGRRREQRVYEGEVMRVRHANLLAEARFLRTRAEPALCYKPWQLRAEEEDRIQDQIREAEATVAREVEEFETRRSAEEEKKSEEENRKPEEVKLEEEKLQEVTQEVTQEAKQDTQEIQEQAPVPESDAQENKDIAQASSVTLGAEMTVDGGAEEAKPEVVPVQDTHVPFTHDHPDIHRHDDDGGEVVEDQEDTVIY
ncbi:hypothetical protein BO70DRAFT_365967 [Aspergillus heteromorphus CBS 117.55]|uniref:Pinin/SDK/MemA protein domain-containing protein n=1 Tax=Aspergillus heteromorphus CBS 117.55 TaxID=1448321 RepID=A0A317VB48_9EURO|nr:uncharacterized protein BO70DRAFT_365967 [Aspergillus heteromorphus CBS 117.55]PWY69150.1 hypothetical protein BO70DRAFT_365967 [Aspergillus heteromorphus CBS 117.55]